MGTSSFLLISVRRVAEESQRPRRWKQWLHTAREMRDSETPVQPKRAKAKATVSVGESGGVVPEDVKKEEGMRDRICWMGGSG
jgi:NADH:ubiquinone oxidoreductase subunit